MRRFSVLLAVAMLGVGGADVFAYERCASSGCVAEVHAVATGGRDHVVAATVAQE